MSKFSKRYEFEPDKPIQITSIDDELRIGLWNALYLHFWIHTEITDFGHKIAGDKLESIVKHAWVHFLKWPLNEFSYNWDPTEDRIKDYFDQMEWYHVYDFIEFMAPLADKIATGNTNEFIDFCNSILETERSAYRFVGNCLAPITDEVEVHQVEEIMRTPYDPIRDQIRSAVTKLSEKPKPDLRNSIKESISAVETAARLVTNNPNGTLGQLLDVLKTKIDLHPSQIEAFKKLYGYTSDDDSGIRHAMMDKSNLTPDDARYMLVVCSAFVHYILRLSEKSGLLD